MRGDGRAPRAGSATLPLLRGDDRGEEGPAVGHRVQPVDGGEQGRPVEVEAAPADALVELGDLPGAVQRPPRMPSVSVTISPSIVPSR